MSDTVLIALALLCIAFVAGAYLWFHRSSPDTSGAPFLPKPVLNRMEAKLFRQIEHRLPEGVRCLAQVSYGEMLRTKDRGRLMTVNARRADIVLVDESFAVLAVFEYQGMGHKGFGGYARARAKRGDAAKRAALQEAGLPLIEIPAEFSTATIDAALAEVLPKGRPADSATGPGTGEAAL